MTIVVVAILTAFKVKTFAQAKYFPGYVVMLNGDTLKGEVKKNPKREFDSFTKAAYRKKEGGGKSKHSTRQRSKNIALRE